MMGGGTPLFPDLGAHCSEKSCRQLDFLPFRCDGCEEMFCAEHRSYSNHKCPNANAKDRVVLICPACSSSVPKVFKEDPSLTLSQHRESADCNPELKRRGKCPVKRCREILTFSNTQECKSCGQKTCMRHRFPSDHGCQNRSGGGAAGQRFLAALEKRQAKGKGNECGTSGGNSTKVGKAASPPLVKAN